MKKNAAQGRIQHEVAAPRRFPLRMRGRQPF
jgi:hypothetical protein